MLNRSNDCTIARHPQSPPLDCKGVESHLDERLDTNLRSDTAEDAEVQSVVGQLGTAEGITPMPRMPHLTFSIHSLSILYPSVPSLFRLLASSGEPTQAEGARGFESDIGPKAEGFIPQVPAPGQDGRSGSDRLDTNWTPRPRSVPVWALDSK